MFKHSHPYPPFIPKGTKKLIVGTLPPPRFTTGDLKQGDVDCWYGSRDNQLWPILDRIFNLNLIYENSEKAIKQRKKFLIQHKIGICDMVDVAYRDEINAADLGIKEFELRPIISILKTHNSVNTLLFTGGNSKNGPEYFFRKKLQNFPAIKLNEIDENVPRIHEFEMGNRKIKTVSLTAPSGSANRAVGSMQLYKKMKAKNSELTTLDFRVIQYTPFFTTFE
ncbi:MAG: uracil-DNA glycosylase family protein [Brumimicrobium sp.]